MLRIAALAVAATAIASLTSFALATPASASADTNCKTIHGAPFPTVEMCLPIPDPGVG